MSEKYIDGWMSYYETGDSTGSLGTVAMQSIKTCPDCEGCCKDLKKTIEFGCQISTPCPRCHGDGELRNQVKYDRDFPGIALPDSICERLGNPIYMTKIKISLIGIHHDICSRYENFTFAFYNDIQKDENCRCGHEENMHAFGLRKCQKENCTCKQYEQRICDVTPTVFEKLAPLSQGLVKVRIEVV